MTPATHNIVAVGLLGDLFSGKMEDPVDGTAQIVSCTGYHEGAMQNCRMQLVLSGEGVEPTAVEHSALIHNRRWPHPGMTLPAKIDRANPKKFKVDFKAIPDSRESAQGSAEAMAAAMRGEGGGAGGAAGMGAGGAQVINLSGGDLSQLSDEQRQKLAALGIDPTALGAGASAAAGGQPAPAGGDDTLEKLQKLADLRDRGALTDAEFADEKKKLLGD
jgi:Short C-terminal domain